MNIDKRYFTVSNRDCGYSILWTIIFKRLIKNFIIYMIISRAIN
jgi:hypothetical protein